MGTRRIVVAMQCSGGATQISEQCRVKDESFKVGADCFQRKKELSELLEYYLIKPPDEE